jgi:repressor LexA
VSEAEPVPNENTYQIPVFESVSAGFGAYANDSIIGYMPLFITSESEAAETIIIRVRGDSMYPRIEDGALIQVHKQNYADNGNIAVVLVDDESAVVKRYFCDINTETVRLESYNPKYPPRIFRGAEIERLKVLGVAKRVITDL